MPNKNILTSIAQITKKLQAEGQIPNQPTQLKMHSLADTAFIHPIGVVISFQRLQYSSFIPRMLHQHFVLKIHIAGSSLARVEDNLYLFQEGDGILIFPFQQHYIEDRGDEECDCLRILAEFSLSNEDTIKLEALRNRPFKIDANDLLLLQRIIGARYHEQFYHHDAVYALSELLIMRAAKAEVFSGIEPLKHKDPKVRKIFEYAFNNFKQNLTLKEIAEKLNMSESSLQLMFKKHSNGMTLGKLLHQLRLKHASELLLHTKKSIGKIASECGFADQFNFCRAFKRECGVTPSLYRHNSLIINNLSNSSKSRLHADIPLE